MCGIPDIDVASLKSSTTYSDELNASHPLVVMFWEAVEGMTNCERSRLLRFVTGRSRLPVTIRLDLACGRSDGEEVFQPNCRPFCVFFSFFF